MLRLVGVSLLSWQRVFACFFTSISSFPSCILCFQNLDAERWSAFLLTEFFPCLCPLAPSLLSSCLLPNPVDQASAILLLSTNVLPNLRRRRERSQCGGDSTALEEDFPCLVSTPFSIGIALFQPYCFVVTNENID